jgi:hypothetical protein
MKDSFLLRSVHAISYTVDIGGFFRGVKQQEREASVEVNDGGAISPVSHTSS